MPSRLPIWRNTSSKPEELGAGLRLWGLAQEFALKLIDRVEAELDRSLKAVTTIERALVSVAVSAAGVAGALATHDAALGAATTVAATIALAKADQLKETVEKAKEAAQRIYEAAKEIMGEGGSSATTHLRGSGRGRR